MKCRSFAVRLAVAVLISVGLAHVAAAGELVPFKGTLEGSFTANFLLPPAINRHLVATGNVTQLGEFTYDFPHSVDRSVMPATGVGFATFTAANGDEVFAFVAGEATLIAPGVLSLVESGTILGGTGRFRECFRKLRCRAVDRYGSTSRPSVRSKGPSPRPARTNAERTAAVGEASSTEASPVASRLAPGAFNRGWWRSAGPF